MNHDFGTIYLKKLIKEGKNEMSNQTKYLELLMFIKENSPQSLEKEIDSIESNFYKYLINQGYIQGAKVQEYMSGAMIYGNSVFLTEKGELYLQELIGNSKPIRMTSKNKYNQMKILLERIEDGHRNLLRPNDRVRENDHLDLLHNMIDEDLVKGISLKYASNKPHLYFSDNIRITEKGYEIMDNEYKEKDNSSEYA